MLNRVGNSTGRKPRVKECADHQLVRQLRVVVLETEEENQIRKYLFVLTFCLQQKKEENPIELRDHETVFENVLNEIVNAVLSEKEMDELLDNCH